MFRINLHKLQGPGAAAVKYLDELWFGKSHMIPDNMIKQNLQLSVPI